MTSENERFRWSFFGRFLLRIKKQEFRPRFSI